MTLESLISIPIPVGISSSYSIAAMNELAFTAMNEMALVLQANSDAITRVAQSLDVTGDGSGGGNPSKDYTSSYTGGRNQEELDNLAKDPSHGSKINEQGIKERQVGLALEERGDLGKIVRDQQEIKGAEFIDEKTGIKWDVKSFVSYPNGHTSPRKGAFTVDRAMKKIMSEFENGHNVIIDTRNLVPEHIDQIIKAINEAGISERILWYP